MRWILLFALLTVGFGFFLRERGEVPIPYMQWVGHLPGDLIITKNGVEIDLPLASSLSVSLVLSLICSALRKKSGA